jgi:hypothetical protein
MMAKDAEVAPSFQPLLGFAANFFGSHETQVAHPMIEAVRIKLNQATRDGLDPGIGHLASVSLQKNERHTYRKG